jgi:hypothetical protein
LKIEAFLSFLPFSHLPKPFEKIFSEKKENEKLFRVETREEEKVSRSIERKN